MLPQIPCGVYVSLKISKLLRQQDRLALTLGTDIRGRSAADAAFAFAMAGVTDDNMYRTLAVVAKQELERVGQRPSFRSKYILQMVEKLAACGLRHDTSGVYRVAADCLASKKEHLEVFDMLSRPDEFDLLSTRPLLWLWRFSARQHKVASRTNGGATRASQQLASKQSAAEWVCGFKNPTLPLVVDVGCGMGVSLLGLATLTQAHQDSFNATPEAALLGRIDWRQCNYVGGDLSQLCVGYARGIAQRWNVDDRLQYTYISAMELLGDIESHYPGEVALIMIQFPTPFQIKDVGNSQLPSDSESGFMVSKAVLGSAASLLERSNGYLLLQSNCEDVAVTMRQTAQDSFGFECVNGASLSVKSLGDSRSSSRTPQRTLEWIKQEGKRAIGYGWSLKPMIPARGATETEISCRLSGTPIHRCLLQKDRAE